VCQDCFTGKALPFQAFARGGGGGGQFIFLAIWKRKSPEKQWGGERVTLKQPPHFQILQLLSKISKEGGGGEEEGGLNHQVVYLTLGGGGADPFWGEGGKRGDRPTPLQNE